MIVAGYFWTSAKTADANGVICKPAATWPRCDAFASGNLPEYYLGATLPGCSVQYWDRGFPQTNTLLSLNSAMTAQTHSSQSLAPACCDAVKTAPRLHNANRACYLHCAFIYRGKL